ncbi:MAG: electron transfer flavoprotein subunit alpha/FixB family protein [Candidatus Latescibacteria bacterium]|nr:electron transfer flavoprotein subunit alpha/FixB family protein [Candidatus Latescibacterota bacterium]
MAGVLAFAEQRDGVFRNAAFEVVSEGRKLANELGGEMVAAVIGSGVESPSASLGRYGADRVLVADEPVFQSYSTEGYAAALTGMIRVASPSIVLLSASAMGKVLGPAVAARLGTGLATDCTGLALDGERVRAERPVYAGKALATVIIRTDPQMATLRPNVFPATVVDEGRVAPVERFTANVDPASIRARVREVVASSVGKLDLTEAPIIVSGGRGLGGPEHFTLVEELAAVLGGVVGASRAVVDLGWRPQSDQVGQTGKTVSPSLYIACGISGAIQHLAGMSSSKCVVAINKDPDAPIFQKADYGIVGDVFEVVPALTAELKRALGR